MFHKCHHALFSLFIYMLEWLDYYSPEFNSDGHYWIPRKEKEEHANDLAHLNFDWRHELRRESSHSIDAFSTIDSRIRVLKHKAIHAWLRNSLVQFLAIVCDEIAEIAAEFLIENTETRIEAEGIPIRTRYSNAAFRERVINSGIILEHREGEVGTLRSSRVLVLPHLYLAASRWWWMHNDRTLQDSNPLILLSLAMSIWQHCDCLESMASNLLRSLKLILLWENPSDSQCIISTKYTYFRKGKGTLATKYRKH